ncbi:MAG: PspA/IM30 family protein [Planctomycetaceae bacterium]
MSYFSRLTDIVTCNLSEILKTADDPAAAIADVISEMEEGLSGCERCVHRAERAASDLRGELDEYAGQIGDWMDKAKTALASGDENAARQALLRKKEVEDLLAGLEREHKAAVATHDSLKTTLRALEARISEARRRAQEIESGTDSEGPSEDVELTGVEATIEASRSDMIEDELAELRRQMGDV